MPLTTSAPTWDVHRPPRAEGRVFLVTGANAGIGYFVAEQLSTTGATVVLGSRDPARADAAMTSIRSRVPGAKVRAVRLDLADLSSLGAAVDSLGVDALDAVVHNAGVALDDPPRRETRDGHELMFGTNHLGHFALTGRLLPLLSAAPAARVVTVGSFAAKTERLDLADLQSRRDYRAKRTYGRSKLAQMYFGLELDRRLRGHGRHPLGRQITAPPRGQRLHGRQVAQPFQQNDRAHPQQLRRFPDRPTGITPRPPRDPVPEPPHVDHAGSLLRRPTPTHAIFAGVTA
ncbi:SDR family NAD(P)-dependent oxidoreductase [Streptomyces sp. NPDC047017]|uniref:SDR family NAD(P)-dependent oxidoreductase n=1 Tax=Streptomyces sp. NPDC047017 TaxID=3155024 RepID=UPI0033FEE478